mgnify:CR=1 FL=1
MDHKDLEKLYWIQTNHPEAIRKTVLEGDVEHCQITDSGSRLDLYSADRNHGGDEPHPSQRATGEPDPDI